MTKSDDIRRAQIAAMRKSFEADGWNVGEPGDATDIAIADEIMSRALSAALAAPGPEAEGVPVRVAVAMTPDGKEWRATGGSDYAGDKHPSEWGGISGGGRTHFVVVTARVPLPAIPEVAGEVQEP